MSHSTVLLTIPYSLWMLPTLGVAVGFIAIPPLLNPLAQILELLL